MSEVVGLGVEEPPNRNGAFPRLDDSQRQRLRAVGELRAVAPGDVLFREGDEGYDFFVVESGRGRDRARLRLREPGDRGTRAHRFLGELNLLTGEQRVSDRRGARPGRGDPGPAPAAASSCCAATRAWRTSIFRAFMARRAILIEGGARGEASSVRATRGTAAGCASSSRATGCRIEWMDLESDERGGDGRCGRWRSRRPRPRS